jgi:hypothetical protein
MFHLAVVLEEGNVVGRGLHTVELVVKMVLDAGALDTRRAASSCASCQHCSA